jgi:tripartite-type tricarboxylate transporter receptor subunit TctC
MVWGCVLRPALRIVVIGAVLGALSPAHAQGYPSRPVKVIVPTPPGGPVDVVGRLTANYLQTTLGQAFVVENRAGAGNTIGSKDAAEATPDGYTLLFSAASGLIIAPLLHPDAGYDPLKSFDPIALVGASRASWSSIHRCRQRRCRNWSPMRGPILAR